MLLRKTGMETLKTENLFQTAMLKFKIMKKDTDEGETLSLYIIILFSTLIYSNHRHFLKINLKATSLFQLLTKH